MFERCNQIVTLSQHVMKSRLLKFHDRDVALGQDTRVLPLLPLLPRQMSILSFGKYSLDLRHLLVLLTQFLVSLPELCGVALVLAIK